FPQPAARSPQPAARSPQPAARSPQPAARSPQPAANGVARAFSAKRPLPVRPAAGRAWRTPFRIASSSATGTLSGAPLCIPAIAGTLPGTPLCIPAMAGSLSGTRFALPARAGRANRVRFRPTPAARKAPDPTSSPPSSPDEQNAEI
ncbi:MAG: hypothetical protein LBK99_26315, partial [Opitutaceae bacterium]|nr:hypothetical protein [Opitutaceae bacterium]